jgi:hypothetical protein
MRRQGSSKENLMSPENIFRIHLVFGYIACLLFFSAYFLPRLRAMDNFAAQRAIATLHSFRFFGLAFFLPGVVGPNLPSGFAIPAAYGDFATSVLAIFALLAARMTLRRVFWLFVVAFQIVGTSDLVLAYFHAMKFGVPALAGQFGAAYAIPILYVPMLMITHVVGLYWLVSRRPQEAGVLAGQR